MRVLVAEDERDLNEIVVQKLKKEGYSVDACYDGAEAMDILSYTEYDAVLLDIMMPKADGFQVLSALRAAGKETPVLFLTARDAIEDRVKEPDLAFPWCVRSPNFTTERSRIRIYDRCSIRLDSGM